jgi:uncharacterized glyoxalase superfamily protein PhnB
LRLPEEAQMLKNRSVPPCTVIPQLYYPDPTAAAEWLCKAFGFKVRLRIGKNHRVQMKAGDGCLVVAESGEKDRKKQIPHDARDDHPVRTHGVMVRIEDALAHCERARLAGAKILTEPVDHMYGERQYNAEDPWGHRWDFTQTIKDVAPEEWGGVPVNLE